MHRQVAAGSRSVAKNCYFFCNLTVNYLYYTNLLLAKFNNSRSTESIGFEFFASFDKCRINYYIFCLRWLRTLIFFIAIRDCRLEYLVLILTRYLCMLLRKRVRKGEKGGHTDKQTNRHTDREQSGPTRVPVFPFKVQIPKK